MPAPGRWLSVRQMIPAVRLSAYQSPLNRINASGLPLPGWGEGLKAKETAPFRARFACLSSKATSAARAGRSPLATVAIP